MNKNILYFLREIFSRKMLSCLLMGFASGLPLLLTGSVLQAWLKDAGVDLTYIGLVSLIGLPYSIKFLFGPFLDFYSLPFLGRRRGWILLIQILLAFSLVALGVTDPVKTPYVLVVCAVLVTLFSSTQDVVLDAYRREDLTDEELGLGSSIFINGYRLGMLLAGGGGLIFADQFGFKGMYIIMAICLLPGMIATLFSPEPKKPKDQVLNFKDAVVEPFVEYFKRDKAIVMLIFILLYKIGDTMAASMTTPFFLDIGFTKTEIGAIVKLFGFWATIGGGLLGGALMLKLGINLSLWVFGFLQMVSTAGFSVLALIGYSQAGLSAVIAFENLASGMGTAAYVAFMASLTNKKFTATQYALLTSMMGIPRIFASAPTGFIAKHTGWVDFFLICTFIAIPGMIMLNYFAPLKKKRS